MKAIASFALLGLAFAKEEADFADGELFKLGNFLSDAAKTYNDVRQPKPNVGNIVNDGIQLVKDIKRHDDEELFAFGNFLNDALKTYNDARQHKPNPGDLVNDGIKLIKDIKQHDDELVSYYEIRGDDAIYHPQMPTNVHVIIEDEELDSEDAIINSKFLRFKAAADSSTSSILHCVDYPFGRFCYYE